MAEVGLWAIDLRVESADEALRAILSAITGTAAAELRIVRGERGKPELEDGSVAFNLSHSGSLALVAAAAEGPVGVDVEELRPRRRLDGIARHAFTAAERDALEGLAGDAQLEAFYAIWTAREAYLKATGTGLPARPGSPEIPLPPAGAERPAPIGGGLSVRRLAPAPGFAAAVVAPGADWTLAMRSPVPPPGGAAPGR